MRTDRYIVPNVEEAMDQDEDVAGGRSSGNSIFSSPVSWQLPALEFCSLRMPVANARIC